MSENMKHLILGAGNLGKDLLLELNRFPSIHPEILSQSRGVGFADYPVLFEEIRKRKPSVLWVTVGGGSVQEAKLGTETHPRAKYLNAILPVTLNEDIPDSCKVVFFSTDYAADEENPTDPNKTTSWPKSEYAAQKIQMEKWLLEQNKPNRAIVRVTSLYGIHKPEKTFPGKILNNYIGKPGKIGLPYNLVTPTPTRWLASILLRNLDVICNPKKTTIHHCAPLGNITVKDWGKMVLRDLREPEDFHPYHKSGTGFDLERPFLSRLECSFDHVSHFEELWNLYYDQKWFVDLHVPSSKVIKTIDFTMKFESPAQ